jgi:surface protein
MRDSDGVQTTPYTFTIRNICNHPADFQINLETLNTSTIDEEFIKADLNGHVTEYNAAESVEPTIDGARSATMLYEDTLAVNSSKTYNLRLWVNESATQEDVENKSYTSKVSVKATVKRQFAEGTLIAGQNFNVALKKLADGGNPNYTSNNTSITSIEWSETAPQESDNAINIAADGTTTPIYAWFKDGTIYINSELDKIYMNNYSTVMFYKMQGVTSLDLSHFDTSNVTRMGGMFEELSSLTSLDLSHFDTSNVTKMESMFYGMNSLTNLDVSNFDTSKATNMSYMFSGTSKLTNLDVSHFDTSRVVYFNAMFQGLYNVPSLYVRNFDTSHANTMNNMFSGCSSLTELDLSNFDTRGVSNMDYMFDNWENVITIYVGNNFVTGNVTGSNYLFGGCTSLVGGAGTTFDSNHIDITYAHVDGGTSNPGYFTLK